MKQVRLVCVTFIGLFLCFTAPISGTDQTPQKGTLVVQVWLGDNNAPARDAFVYVKDYLGQSSTTLSANKPGVFELRLAPGLYDVFVGELSSLPMCKRIEIKPDRTKVYTAKLEADEDNLQN
jgi:hypothetical protein